MNENPTTPRHRAEGQSTGYRTVGHIDLDSGVRVNVVDVADLDQAAEAFGSLRLLADLVAEGKNRAIAEMASALAGFWQQRMRLLAAGALAAVAVAAIGGLSLAYAPGAMAAETANSVPAIEAPQPDPAPVVCPLHATRWGRGYWQDMGAGDVLVSAPLTELVGNLGWLPSPWALINVQQLRRGRWVTVASLHTSAADGRATGIVHVGGGVKYLRVVHPQDMWTAAATGSTRRVVVTTEPLDIL